MAHCALTGEAIDETVRWWAVKLACQPDFSAPGNEIFFKAGSPARAIQDLFNKAFSG
jgi:hypothetical protein